MSRFRPDRLRVSVKADRVALVKLSGFLKARIEAETQIPVCLDLDQAGGGLDALETELATGQWQAGSVEVVLSDQLVRYFVAEAVPGTRNLEELRELVAGRFEEIFGLPAADWEIRTGLLPFASRFLACAIDRRLLAELRRLFAGNPGQRLASVQPFLVREFNCWRPRLGSEPLWLAAAERRSITLALLAGRAWQGLRSHRIDAGWQEALPTLLARDQIAYGLAETPARLWLTGSAAAGALTEAGGPLQPAALDSPAWPGRSAAWSRDYRLALAGIWP